MAKITRHGGPSDAHNPDREDKLLESHEGGNPTEAYTGEPAGEPHGDPSEDGTGDPGAESAGVELPPTGALKSVWEDAAVEAGLSTEWVYAEGRTKDQLVETARGVVAGAVKLDQHGEPVDGEQSESGESDGEPVVGEHGEG